MLGGWRDAACRKCSDNLSPFHFHTSTWLEKKEITINGELSSDEIVDPKKRKKNLPSSAQIFKVSTTAYSFEINGIVCVYLWEWGGRAFAVCLYCMYTRVIQTAQLCLNYIRIINYAYINCPMHCIATPTSLPHPFAPFGEISLPFVINI